VPVVTVKQTLSVPADRVWELVCDIEAYPRLMDSVIATHLVEEVTHPTGVVEAVTDWEIELKGSILKWREREWRDPATRRITYVQVSGDLAKFEGYWQVTSIGEETTEAILEVDFEIGIEMLRAMLDPIAIRAIERNSAEMLQSLGRKVD
jgi:ribosome-associated toxin RatA of RatAB toxin-antitoxin module